MKKILFIFYGLFFKAMTFSACPEAFKNISNRLLDKQVIFCFTSKSWTCQMSNVLCRRIFVLKKPHSGLSVHQSVAKKLSLTERGAFMRILSGHSVSNFQAHRPRKKQHANMASTECLKYLQFFWFFSSLVFRSSPTFLDISKNLESNPFAFLISCP